MESYIRIQHTQTENNKMTYKIIEYQEKNVNLLLDKITLGGDGKYMFLAPTGSGKTVMMSKFLERFIAKNTNYAFIWASPRKNLPLQSKGKIESNHAVDCVLTDTITANRRIEQNQVWFINWEKMHGNLMTGTEDGNSLNDIIKNTKEDGLKIMLLVDEAHWGAQKSGTTTNYAIDSIINADIMVYITATPKKGLGPNQTVKVSLKDVRDEEMVVSEIPLNYDLEEDDVTMQADEKLLDMACKRKKILKEQYVQAGTNINPLLMVQIPNSKEGEQKREIVEKILERHDMTEEQGNFVSLEDGRRDDEYVKNISDNDSKIDAVIFKQNVSLGWDCPRAKLLVGLRDTKNESFRLQTLGRIMRMPEQKYYKNEEMNIAYFYSEGRGFVDPEGTIQSMLRGTAKADRKAGISMPDLPAVRIRMVDLQEGLDTEEFKRIFRELAKENNIINRMRRASEIKTAVLTKSQDITYDAGKNGDEYTTLENELVIQKEFEWHISGILNDDDVKCKNLFNMEFIKNLIKEAISEMFVDAGKNDSIEKIYYQLIDAHNVVLIKPHIIETMNRHEKIMRKLLQGGVDNFEWNVPKSQLLSKCSGKDVQNDKTHPTCVMNYNGKFNKYAMSPVYLEIASKPEHNFCRELDQSRNVKWWYKNGTGRGDFAIVYYDGCRPRRFMPDFIVMMNDGRIGIFDTKSGNTLEKAGLKARALYDYMTEHPALNLFGGIVTLRDTKWVVNDGSEFTPNLGDVHWKKLNSAT